MSDTSQLKPDQNVQNPRPWVDTLSEDNVHVWFDTFEEARITPKPLSDTFIDGAIEGKLYVGGKETSIKGYLDNVELTERDREVIGDPERIAKLYASTTEILARNLKLFIARSDDPDRAMARQHEIKQLKEHFIDQSKAELPNVTSEIMDWYSGNSRMFPVDAMEYTGLVVDGQDVLNAAGKGVADVRPNFKIQRQLNGTFLMAYSDVRVHEKMSGKDTLLDKRIYLNPDMEATPELFEQLLGAANESGIPMQLKMLQRAPEAASVHKAENEGRQGGGLRGDGVVVYVSEKHSDDVLRMCVALAKDQPDAFKNRRTSRIPQKVAEGIAVGDEPVQMQGASLTSHREKIFSYAAQKVRETGQQGQEARILFRGTVRQVAIDNGVNPDNMAFNAT